MAFLLLITIFKEVIAVVEKKYPRVAAQVLSWNQVDEVVTCLDSFSCIDYPNYEVILVDNGSEDNTVEAVRLKFPWVTIIETGENLGFCKGNNIGIQYCLEKGFDYVLLLNSDIKVLPNLISELVRVMQNDPKIGIAGAKNLLLEDPAYMWGQYGEVTWGPLLVRTVGRFKPNLNLNESPKDVDWVICNACMVSREALQKVGGFDEDFWQCNEDVDWSYRAREAGFRIVYVDTTAIHHKGSSSGDVSRIKRFNYGYFIGRNAFSFAKKHGTRLQIATLFVMVWLGIAVRISILLYFHLIQTAKIAIGLKKNLVAKRVFDFKAGMAGQRYFIHGVMDGLRGTQRPSEFVIRNDSNSQKTSPDNSPPRQPAYTRTGLLNRFARWIGF